MSEIAFYVMAAVFIVSEIGHFLVARSYRRERSEMLNRLMARDLTEYTNSARKEPPKPRENWLKHSIEARNMQRFKEWADDDE